MAYVPPHRRPTAAPKTALTPPFELSMKPPKANGFTPHASSFKQESSSTGVIRQRPPLSGNSGAHQHKRPGVMACKFHFGVGYCRKGAACRFSHEAPLDHRNSPPLHGDRRYGEQSNSGSAKRMADEMDGSAHDARSPSDVIAMPLTCKAALMPPHTVPWAIEEAFDDCDDPEMVAIYEQARLLRLVRRL